MLDFILEVEIHELPNSVFDEHFADQDIEADSVTVKYEEPFVYIGEICLCEDDKGHQDMIEFIDRNASELLEHTTDQYS